MRSISWFTSFKRSGRSLRVLRPSSVRLLSMMYVAIALASSRRIYRRRALRVNSRDAEVGMKAAVWNDKGSLDVAERPAPEPKPGWVRLRVAAVGICGTDLHFHRGAFPSPAGLQPGHEIGGVVDTAGPGLSLAAGTAVAVDPWVR